MFALDSIQGEEIDQEEIALKKRIQNLNRIYEKYCRRLEKIKSLEHDEKLKLNEITSKVKLLLDEINSIREEIDQLGTQGFEDESLLDKITAMVKENEQARAKESDFKESCRKESDRMKNEIARIEEELKELESSPEITEKYKGKTLGYNFCLDIHAI